MCQDLLGPFDSVCQPVVQADWSAAAIVIQGLIHFVDRFIYLFIFPHWKWTEKWTFWAERLARLCKTDFQRKATTTKMRNDDMKPIS